MNVVLRSPSPRPSPPGRGRIVSSLASYQALDLREPDSRLLDRPLLFPLPEGEGQGEGKRDMEDAR